MRGARNHQGKGSFRIGCQVNTPKTPMIAPTVVYHNKIPQRISQPASGKKKGNSRNPANPKRKPMSFPTAIRVISEGLPNIGISQFEMTKASYRKYRTES